jgi:hypothetical protein
MLNNPGPPNKDNRLNRVELAVQRVEDQVAQLIKDFADFKARMECMIEDHQTALYGDRGKPGLVGQTGTLEELRVALKGYGREPGLIAEIQTLSKKIAEWEDAKKWIIRLIIGLIVTNILTIILK